MRGGGDMNLDHRLPQPITGKETMKNGKALIEAAGRIKDRLAGKPVKVKIDPEAYKERTR